jgi:plastocyanin
VVHYENAYRLCYIRGPEGILIGLAQAAEQACSWNPTAIVGIRATMRLIPDSICAARAFSGASLITACIALAACGGGGDPATGPSEPRLGTVTIASQSPSVVAGSTLQLTATARDTDGGIIQASISWSTSANSIASVSSAGLVNGVAPGTATITATAVANGVTVTGTRQITVTAPFVPVLTSVSITAPATALNINGTVQLSATPRDQAGGAMSATVTWTSSATGVATVNQTTGVVTAIAPGSTTITARAAIGSIVVTADQVINVSSVPLVLTSVAITAPANTVAIGSTLALQAVARDQLGNVFNANVSWTTSDAQRATVNAQGVVTGTGLGAVVITVTATSGSVSVQSTVSLTVISPFPAAGFVTATASNVFTPNTVEIAVGGTVSWTFQSAHDVRFGGTAGAPSDIEAVSGGSISRTFPNAGRFEYLCSLHIGMTGTVIVQ